MTYQRDPDHQAREDHVRREGGSWGMLPILIGLALVFGLGYLMFGTDWSSRTDGPANGQRTERPATQPTPAPTPAPKQP